MLSSAIFAGTFGFLGDTSRDGLEFVECLSGILPFMEAVAYVSVLARRLKREEETVRCWDFVDVTERDV